MNNILLLIIAILPVFLIGLFIYKKDKEKEPKELLIKLFAEGIGSCYLALEIGRLLELLFPIFSSDYTSLNLLELLIYFFIGVALVEEFSKWLAVYIFSYNRSEFDQFYDMIVYAVFTSLGFACFENVLYVTELGIGTGIFRALTAIPGHACDGVLMGYFLGIAKINALNNRKLYEIKNIILSIIVPTITHGIYDYCLSTGKLIFIIIFLIFLISMYIYVFKKVKKISKITRKMKYENNYCSNCGRLIDSNYCPICGRKND